MSRKNDVKKLTFYEQVGIIIPGGLFTIGVGDGQQSSPAVDPARATHRHGATLG